MPHSLKYRVLEKRLAICQLATDAQIPAWALEANFFSVVRTADELSIVCPEDRVPNEARAERGWLALQLAGPFPFSMAGVLASFLAPLAAAHIPVFAISTFDTDYVLIKTEHQESAISALAAAGHERIAAE